MPTKWLMYPLYWVWVPTNRLEDSWDLQNQKSQFLGCQRRRICRERFKSWSLPEEAPKESFERKWAIQGDCQAEKPIDFLCWILILGIRHELCLWNSTDWTSNISLTSNIKLSDFSFPSYEMLRSSSFLLLHRNCSIARVR